MRYVALIKGRPGEAVTAAKAHHIIMTDDFRMSGEYETLARVDATLQDLQEWFNEAIGQPAPFAPGTLLHFSALETGVV